MDKKTRNDNVVRDRASGMTLSAVSAKYGIGMERVRQIVFSAERDRSRIAWAANQDPDQSSGFSASDRFMACGMSVRLSKCLAAEGFSSLNDFDGWDPTDENKRKLMRVPNFGRVCLNELITVLTERGLLGVAAKDPVPVIVYHCPHCGGALTKAPT
jgi:hypothetical protein